MDILIIMLVLIGGFALGTVLQVRLNNRQMKRLEETVYRNLFDAPHSYVYAIEMCDQYKDYKFKVTVWFLSPSYTFSGKRYLYTNKEYKIGQEIIFYGKTPEK